MSDFRAWLARFFGRRSRTPYDSPVGWSSMAALLDDLDGIADQHHEVFDTDVRERLWAVVDDVLISRRSPVRVPEELGMFTDEGNRKLRGVLERHLAKLRDVFETFGLDTPERRLKSFQNPALRSERGRRVDEFFGHP